MNNDLMLVNVLCHVLWGRGTLHQSADASTCHAEFLEQPVYDRGLSPIGQSRGDCLLGQIPVPRRSRRRQPAISRVAAGEAVDLE